MKQIYLNESVLPDLMELNDSECLKIEGGSWIGDIGEAVGGALGFTVGVTFRVVSGAAKIANGVLVGRMS